MKILKMIGLVIILFLAVSCFSKSESTDVSLTFSIWGTPEKAKVEKQIIKKFNKDFPNIRIKLIHRPAQGYHKKILVSLYGDDAPDVMMIERSYFNQLADKNVLVDLTPYMKRDHFDKDAYFDLTWKNFTHNGKYYALPRDISGYVMYYNKTLLRKNGLNVPTTWREFERVCKQLKSDTDGDGVVDQWGSVLTQNEFFSILWGNGGDVFDDPVNPTKSLMNSEAAFKSLNMVYRMYKNQDLASADVIRDQGTYQLFMMNKVGFYFSGRWSSTELRNIKDFEWDAADIPAGPKGHFAPCGGTAYGISKKSKHPNAAWTFIKFYTGEKGLRAAIKGGRTTPAIKKLAYSEEFLSQRPPHNTMAFVRTMEIGRQWCYSKNYIEYRDLFLYEFDKIYTLQESIGSIQNNLHEGLTRLLRENK